MIFCTGIEEVGSWIVELALAARRVGVITLELSFLELGYGVLGFGHQADLEFSCVRYNSVWSLRHHALDYLDEVSEGQHPTVRLDLQFYTACL